MELVPGTKANQRQRGGIDFIGNVDGLAKGIKGQDGEDWTKRLLCHHAVVGRIEQDRSGGDEELGLVHLATHDDLTLTLIHHLLHAQKVSLIDHASQIRTRLGTIGERLLEGGIEVLDELVHYLTLNQDVVLGQAHLAGIQGLAPEQTLCGQLEVGVAGDESRIATAQFEADGGQVLGSLFANDSGHTGTSGVEDLVPLLVEQSRGLGHGTGHHPVGRRVQGLFDDFLDDHGDVRTALGGLDNASTASSNGANQGVHAQHKREVVGADDKGSTQRLLANLDVVGFEVEGNVRAAEWLVLGPLVEMLEHKHAVVGDPVDLGEHGLISGLAQIDEESLLQLGLVVLDSPVELAQLHLAVLEVLGLEGAEGGPDGGAEFRNGVHGRGSKRRNSGRPGRRLCPCFGSHAGYAVC